MLFPGGFGTLDEGYETITLVRTGRFMATRLIALVEHPATDERGRVEVTTRHRLEAGDRG